MGAIRAEVREQHLATYPSEEGFIKAFVPNFFVTWARRRKAFNTELSLFFLNPEAFISEAYGIELEVMLAYSPFTTMEPRSIQAVESFFNDIPAKGRVERLVYFFVSEAANVADWFQQYAIENQESRLVIPVFAEDLRNNANDPWFVRNKMNQFIYGRDLFDFRLPLEHDISFFGRADLVLSLHNSVKRSENRGIFGLRKTGKTSLLYKLERLINAEGSARVFYYDCKLPSIRKLHWNDLLCRICTDIAESYEIKVDITNDDLVIDKSFRDLIQKITGRILLVFDEIEYISPVAIEDKHWHREFVTFWQAFWAVQSKNRKICTLIAGVNPWVVETDAVGGIQNPLFGIVSHEYLRGLLLEETHTMVRTLSRRMGLKFSSDAVDHIHKHYGGHPLLTRIACSILNSQCRNEGMERPIEISLSSLALHEPERDDELSFYCQHVVSELRQFYLSEYEMLELIACGQIVDFLELDFQVNATKHLVAYGLLQKHQGKTPVIAIPVISRFVAMEHARRSGRKTLVFVTPKTDRLLWLDRRKDAILHDLRLLETTIVARKKSPVYGLTSIPEADRFMKLLIVETDNEFESFINTCNRCLVESIENYGKQIGKSRYFWNEIKEEYPTLWRALLRIRIYRNEMFHIQLTATASSELLGFLGEDLDGRSVNSVDDGYFILQQCVMDMLLAAIQVETAALT